MARKFKVLGLALVAVFALCAVVASAASAQGKLTSDGSVTLKGTQTGEEADNALVAFGGSEITCPEAFYTGHEFATTPHTYVPSGATKVTLTPHYGKCKALGFPATVDMNGCDYVLDLEGTDTEDVYDVKSTVICPENKHISVTVFTGTSHAIRACTITIEENGPEEGYSGLQVTDNTNGHLGITGPATEIEASRSGFGCATETEENAELKIDVTVEGLNSSGKATGISLSH